MSKKDIEKEKSKDIGLDPGDGLCGMGGRILEIRKEKSRDAARSRRGKENYEFYELAKLLPLPAAITSQLDKASIIRLSISYLKLRDFSGHGDPPWNRDCPPPNKTLKGAQRRRNSAGVALELFELHQGAHILQSLDGFAFALSSDGRFLYISETVSIYLGLSQVEMAGISMFDYVHHQDHQELAEELGLSLASVTSSLSSPSSPSSDSQSSQRAITPPLSDRVPTMMPNLEKGSERCFCVRMKSTLTKRGVHVRSSGYRVVMIVGRFRRQLSFGLGRKSATPLFGLVGIAIALPPPTITELRLESDTFIMRLTPQFKIVYCENVISSLTDWKSEDLSGKDFYCFCHPGDLLLLRKVHTDIIAKGQVLSPSIRMLNKHGGFVWVQICATALYNSKSTEDQTVLAILHVLSSVKHKDCILSLSQQSSCPLYSMKTLNKEDSIDASETKSTETRPSSADELSNSTICDYSMSVQSNTNPAERHEKPDEVPDILCEKADSSFLEDITSSSDHYKFEGKTSRRKADRPRKRRRDCESDDDDDTSSESIGRDHGKDRNSDNLLENSCGASDALNLSACGKDSFSASLAKESRKLIDSVVESPEDLSVKSAADRTSEGNSAQSLYKLPESHTSMEPHNIGSHSVRELEKIMSRHFPIDSPDRSNSAEISDSLKQKSTIQWIGSSPAISTDSMSASAFLRQLYTSRESVIRSNHGRPCVYNGDLSSLNMLTPPGTDLFKDQLQLNIPQIALQNRTTLFNSQPTESLVSSTNDAFSMTPPSSVSPQEKVVSPFHDNAINEHVIMHYGATASEEIARSRNTVSSALQPENSRLPFLTVPNTYQHGEPADFHQCGHATGQTSTIMNYNARSANNNIWYGSAYTS